MEALSPYIQKGFDLAVQHIPVDTAAKAICFFGCTGLLKIFYPAPLKGQWPRLPSWFWAPCGVWEMVAFFLLAMPSQYMKAISEPTGQTELQLREIGFLMSFAFLGGTSCATTALAFEPVPLFFTLATLVVVSVVGHSHKLAVGQNNLIAYVGGYAAGLFFGVVLARPKGAKKGSKKQ